MYAKMNINNQFIQAIYNSINNKINQSAVQMGSKNVGVQTQVSLLRMMSNCDVCTFPLVSWIRCCVWLYRFLIFALFLTLGIQKNRLNGTVLMSTHNIIMFWMRNEKNSVPIRTLIWRPVYYRKWLSLTTWWLFKTLYFILETMPRQ